MPSNEMLQSQIKLRRRRPTQDGARELRRYRALAAVAPGFWRPKKESWPVFELQPARPRSQSIDEDYGTMRLGPVLLCAPRAVGPYQLFSVLILLCDLPACVLHPRRKGPFRSNTASSQNAKGCPAPGCATH